MVAGRIFTETTADALAPTRMRSGASSASSRSPRPSDAGASRVVVDRRRATKPSSRRGGAMATVVLVGTLDTKGEEYAYLADRLREHGVDVVLVDAGIVGAPLVAPDVTREEVAAAVGADVGRSPPRATAAPRSRRWRAARPRSSSACTPRGGSTRSAGSAARAARRSRPTRCGSCRSACRS